MYRRFAAFTCLAFAPVLGLLTFGRWDEGRTAQEEQAIEGVLAPTREHGVVAREVAARLEEGHYRRLRIDDALSARILARYLDLLDPRRSVFLASDVAEFGRWEDELDDAIRAGELEPAFAIFRRYLERMGDQVEYLQTFLQGDLDAIDFEDGEVLEADRGDAPWPRDRAELEELWRKRFEGEILSLKLDKLDKLDTEGIREVLEKRYATQLRFFERYSADDVNQFFLNALASSYDPHTQYLGRKSSEDFSIDMRLSVEGIGALLSNDGEYVFIQRLIPGGPAEKSGKLRATDRIVSVAQDDEEPVDVIGWRTDEVAQIVRGPAGSVVMLAVLTENAPEGSAPRTVTMVREAVALEERAARSNVLEVFVPAGDGEAPPRRFGVIELPDFYMDFEAYRKRDPNFRSTTRDVAKELEELARQDVEGIVLDLRRNGGGSLVEVTELAGLFVGKRPIVQVQGIDPTKPPDVLRPQTDRIYDGPLLVMVDRSSASASEIFAGAMQDYGRAIVVGERTFGKGTVQGILPVSSGDLFLTQAKYYRVTGASTQLRGVEPDLRFPDGFDEDSYGEGSMDGALRWDEIAPAVPLDSDGPAQGMTVGRYGLLSLLPELRHRHETRAAADPEYKRSADRLEYFEELGRKSFLSIDESVRVAEQEAHEARLLAIENAYRAATGQEPLETLAEENGDGADAEDEPSESSEPSEEGEEGEEPEPDPFQIEAARILADYVDLLRAR